MPSRSKAKGNRAEARVVSIFREAGVDAKRAWGSNGNALGQHETVDVMAGQCRIQVKARKALPAIIRDSLTQHVDAAVLIQDRTEPVVIIRMENFVQLVKDGFFPHDRPPKE